MTLPGASSIPAADAGHIRMASGMRPQDRGKIGVGGFDARKNPDPQGL